MITGPILQITPRISIDHSGVADYARILADRLRAVTGRDSLIGDMMLFRSGSGAAAILHYVNYGYHPRGLPNDLVLQAHDWRRRTGGQLLTIFHETYASGPVWKSAFWLRPLQKRIARSVAALSNHCIVNNDVALAQLRRLFPTIRAKLAPTFSNFGEPLLSADQIAGRDPRHWVICGGTGLIERSLRSFQTIRNQIPADHAPSQLDVFGGADSAVIRSLIASLGPLPVRYRPSVAAAEASEILGHAGFGWIDYFSNRHVSPAVIFKSGIFAAYCAHAVVPVLPSGGGELRFDGQRLPGPFFIDRNAHNLPKPSERAEVATRLYQFYRDSAASEVLAQKIARMLQ